ELTERPSGGSRRLGRTSMRAEPSATSRPNATSTSLIGRTCLNLTDDDGNVGGCRLHKSSKRPGGWSKPHLSSAGPSIVRCSCIVWSTMTPLAALIALRIAQRVRFGLEQGVQRLLHAPSHDPLEVALDPLVVNRDDIVQRTRL